MSVMPSPYQEVGPYAPGGMAPLLNGAGVGARYPSGAGGMMVAPRPLPDYVPVSFGEVSTVVHHAPATDVEASLSVRQGHLVFISGAGSLNPRDVAALPELVSLSQLNLRLRSEADKYPCLGPRAAGLQGGALLSFLDAQALKIRRDYYYLGVCKGTLGGTPADRHRRRALGSTVDIQGPTLCLNYWAWDEEQAVQTGGRALYLVLRPKGGDERLRPVPEPQRAARQAAKRARLDFARDEAVYWQWVPESHASRDHISDDNEPLRPMPESRIVFLGRLHKPSGPNLHNWTRVPAGLNLVHPGTVADIESGASRLPFVSLCLGHSRGG